jgi:hypothetical protein
MNQATINPIDSSEIKEDTATNFVFLSKHKTVSLICGLVLVIAMIVGGAYYLGFQTSQARTKGVKSNVAKGVSPTPTLTIPTPLANTVYLATYQNQSVLFITNDALNNYFADGSDHNDVQIGHAQAEGGMFNTRSIYFPSPLRFSDLDSPTILFRLDDSHKFADISGFIYNEDKTKLFVMVDNNNAQNNGVTSELFAIDLTHHSDEKIWSHNTEDHTYAPESGSGDLHDAILVGDYITVSISTCYNCEPSATSRTLIVNTKTGKELYLGLAGDLIIKPDTKSVTYRKLSPVEETLLCDNPGNCMSALYGETYTNSSYKPTGTPLTVQLP